MSDIHLGFLPKPISVPIDRIRPSRKLQPGLADSHKFKQIRSSIRHIDLIEPLSVGPVDRTTGQHALLDGHVRLQALKDLGFTEVPCLVATDDESYTYNNHICRLSSVQEHFMIRRAIDRGIPAAHLAEVLRVDLSLVLKKSNLLEGICPEAIEVLKDRVFSADLTPALRRMKSVRQVECAELMVSANNFTVPYMRALLAGTPPDMLVAGKQVRRPVGISAEQVAKMEREMGNLVDQYKAAEASYGEDILNLVFTRGYVVKLLDNPNVLRFLQRDYPDVLAQFANIVKSTSMEE